MAEYRDKQELSSTSTPTTDYEKKHLDMDLRGRQQDRAPRAKDLRTEISSSPLMVKVTRSEHGDAEKSIELASRLSTHHLVYSLVALVLGLACVIGGVVLFIHGVTGSTSWTAKILGAESHLNDAAPGTVLFIVGLFIVWITRYSVKLKM